MKTELKYGLLFAGIVVAWVLLEHVLGFNTTRHEIGNYTRFAGVLVPIAGVFFGIKAKRDKELGGQLTFGQGVKTGTLVAVVQTTLTTLWFWLYGSVINPTYMSTMLDYERRKMVAQGMTQGAIDTRVASLTSFYAFPKLQIFQEVVGIAYGVVFALIFAWLLRSRPSASAAPMV